MYLGKILEKRWIDSVGSAGRFRNIVIGIHIFVSCAPPMGSHHAQEIYQITHIVRPHTDLKREAFRGLICMRNKSAITMLILFSHFLGSVLLQITRDTLGDRLRLYEILSVMPEIGVNDPFAYVAADLRSSWDGI